MSTTTFAWEELLARWNRAVLQSEYADDLPPDVVASGWLGFPGAGEDQITAAEARLGTTFPPSYRAFLHVTNGWRFDNGFAGRLWSTEEVEWYATRHQDLIDAWMAGVTSMHDIAGGPPPVSEEEYRFYEAEQAPLRDEYLQTALEISDEDDGVLLLNPRTLSDDGEWEAWFFAHWIPGAQRYRSFWNLMQGEYERFVEMLKYQRGEPTPYADPSLGVDAADFDALLAALADPPRRAASAQALGNLRDRRAFEPLLVLFQNPDEALFVRECAARALGMLRDERAAAPLIDAFRSKPAALGDVKVKTIMGGGGGLSSGAAGLDMFGELSLTEFFGQMEQVMDRELVDRLRTLGGASSFSTLGERASAGINDHLLHAVRQALLELGPAAHPALFAALSDADPAVRASAAMTLCYARGMPGIFEQVSRALYDPDPHVRSVVAANLEQLFDPRAIDPLLAALEGGASEVRVSAAVAFSAMLRYTDDARIVAALERMQQHDPDPRARDAAAAALAAAAGRFDQALALIQPLFQR